MRVRRVLALLATIVIASQIALRWSGRNELARGDRVYQLLAREHALNEQFTPVMATILRETDPPVAAAVNEPYRPGRLHVYVVNLDRLSSPVPLRSIGIDSSLTLQQAAQRNVLVLPPDVMLVDDAFLAFLIVDSVNDVVGMMQAIDATDEALERAHGDEGAASADRVRAAKIERYRTASLYQQLVNLSGLADRNGRDELRDVAAKQSTVFVRDEARQSARLIAGAFSPLLAHELAHLGRADMGQFDVSRVLGFGTAIVRNEEIHADRMAEQYIETRVRAALAENAPGRPFSLELEPLIWFGKLLAQEALIEMFEGFRGLSALQVLVDIDQRGCGAAGIYPVDARGFRSARLNEIPILTEEEWRSMRAKVDARTKGTHDLDIQRAVAYLQPIRVGERSLDVAIAPHLLFFAALMLDQPEGIFEKAPAAALPARMDAVVAALRPAVTMERAVAFEQNRTMIGRFRDGGYVEVRASGDGGVEQVRFIVLRKTREETDVEETTLRFVSMLEVVSIASGVPRAQSDRAFVGLARPNDIECREQTRELVLGRARLRYRNILRTNAFLLEIEAA